MEVLHTAVGLGIRQGHPEVVVDRTGLVVEHRHIDLAEELHTVLVLEEEERRIGLEAGRRIDLVLAGERRTDLEEERHIDPEAGHRTGLEARRIHQVVRWSFHPWHRSFGQWHQEVA